MSFTWRCIALLLGLVFPPLSAQEDENIVGQVYQDERLQIEWLFAENEVMPGDEVLQAFRIVLSPGWHIYWKHAGDSGTPPRIEWLQPENWQVSDFYWPAPSRIELPPLVNFGYEKEVYLPFSVAVPADLSGETVRLSLELDWLVCEENCIPGIATFTVDMPVANHGVKTPSKAAAVLDFAMESYPELHRDWELIDNDPSLTLQVKLPPPASQWESFDFFPYEKTGVENQGYEFKVQGDHLLINLPRSAVAGTEEFAGLLKLLGDQGGELALRLEEGGVESGQNPVRSKLPLIMIFALLGGLILNLMPCVLPVLSIKLMQMLGQNRDDRKAAFHGSLLYTLGVLLSFLGLAGILLAIKAAGVAAGWGFQLQSPYFVAAIACLFFFLGLNFLGLIAPWDALTRLGNLEQKTSGPWQHFSSGVLAVIVASPCTGPFMGVSIGYALAQPAWIALLLFAVLGFGFALPFLILGRFPQALRFLPKPGAWMETLRQFMAFPLFLTVLWLLWVLAQQTDDRALVLIFAAFLAIAFGAWFERRAELQKAWTKLLNWSVILTIVGLVIYALPQQNTAVKNATLVNKEDVWQEFSVAAVEKARVTQPVFIDFTAAWCVTCQVNKRLVLSREDVLARFAEHNFALFQADWTDYNATIGDYLESFGRNGVPLYVIYPQGVQREAIILPEILTPDLVESFISQALL
ncbi:MAG: protein-disulfide reductase DsbD family protein [Oligoflexus sp.]